MNEEIKEILEDIKEIYYFKPLLDYITNFQEENERLKNGYCELKVKCNNGECDCTNEEYDGMVQANMRGSLLLEDYKSRIDKTIEYIKDNEYVSLNHKELLKMLGDGEK